MKTLAGSVTVYATHLIRSGLVLLVSVPILHVLGQPFQKARVRVKSWSGTGKLWYSKVIYTVKSYPSRATTFGIRTIFIWAVPEILCRVNRAPWLPNFFPPQGIFVGCSRILHRIYLHIYALLTKLVWPRWLDIGLVLFCFLTDLDFVSVHKNAKKKRTWPISSHLDRASSVNKEFIIWPKDYTKRARYAHLARSSSQSEHRIRFILPALLKGSDYNDSTGKNLVLWKSGRFRGEVVAYERWSHMVVRP